MQNQKKVKSLIVCCVLAIIILLIVSVALIVNINLAKNELADQQKQLTEIQRQIDKLNNPPSNNDQTITEGED